MSVFMNGETKFSLFTSWFLGLVKWEKFCPSAPLFSSRWQCWKLEIIALSHSVFSLEADSFLFPPPLTVILDGSVRRDKHLIAASKIISFWKLLKQMQSHCSMFILLLLPGLLRMIHCISLTQCFLLGCRVHENFSAHLSSVTCEHETIVCNIPLLCGVQWIEIEAAGTSMGAYWSYLPKLFLPAFSIYGCIFSSANIYSFCLKTVPKAIATYLNKCQLLSYLLP